MFVLCNLLYERSQFKEATSQHFPNYRNQAIFMGWEMEKRNLGKRLRIYTYLSAAIRQKRNSICPRWFEGSLLKPIRGK